MPKLRGPLLSLEARGRLTKLFSYLRRRGHHIVEAVPVPTDAKSAAQLFNRHMFSKCVDLWHLLSDAEKQEWESLARPRHMTGYAWFISQCLRPNPGIYLPLQGGTMAGDIDMDKFRILDLPIPTDDQEAATMKYHDDNLPAGPYTEGTRVYHSAHQSIDNITWTPLAFNSERYDTDEIHDPVTNNSRLTCKTPGKYLIVAHLEFQPNATGIRVANITLDTVTLIVRKVSLPPSTDNCSLNLSTIVDMALNQYVRVIVYQSSGGNLLVYSTPQLSPEFMMQRIG